MHQTCPFTYTSSTPDLSSAIRSLTPLIMLNCQIMGSYPSDQSSLIYQQSNPKPEYDFIIVGAGSAGCAIAGRLSEIAAWKILLIEAGDDPPINSDIPFLYSTLVKSPYDWNYTTEATGDTCLGSINNQCAWSRGKVLGGSSSTNFLGAIRGNPKDYDNWESMGNTGWGYKDVLKYFKKLENLRVPKYTDKSAHGYFGNVFLEQYTNNTVYDNVQAKDYIVDYCIEAGYKIVPDMNAHHQAGITLLPGTMKDDVRWNTAKAYLQPARKRPNLVVMKGTMVTEILINSQKSAYGVRVYKNGKYKNIFSRKEVIVSAGSINSPQLLMLSGIGPKDHLKKFNIPVKKNSCVGCNLRDHLAAHCFIGEINKELDGYSKNHPASYYLKEYLTKRKDIGFAMDAMLFINTTGYTADYPNIQIFHIILNRDSFLQPYYLNVFSLKPEIVDQSAKSSKNYLSLNIFPVLLRPKSHGRIFLKSRNPFVHPEIVTGYLTERADVNAFIDALRIIEKISQNDAFKKHTILKTIPVDDCVRHGLYSDAYYECLVRYFGTTTFHPSGTCKMGPSSDPNAVVSPELKVYGIQRLRVADASVMPQLTSGNINIPVIMIGEKASDLIKKDWL